MRICQFIPGEWGDGGGQKQEARSKEQEARSKKQGARSREEPTVSGPPSRILASELLTSDLLPCGCQSGRRFVHDPGRARVHGAFREGLRPELLDARDGFVVDLAYRLHVAGAACGRRGDTRWSTYWRMPGAPTCLANNESGDFGQAWS